MKKIEHLFCQFSEIHRRLTKSIIIAIILSCFLAPLCALAQEPAKLPELTVFYSPGCHNCTKIKKEIIPLIEKEFSGRIKIEYRDVDNIENYKLMLSLEEKNNVEIENTMPVFHFEGYFLNGKGEVKNALEQIIILALDKPQANPAQMPAIDLMARFQAMKPLVVTLSGLIDGINPCAFTVIIFFISFLALQGYRKRALVVIGLTFISSVFITYLLIGLGLFSFLYRLEGFWLASRIINFSIGVFSIVLGVLSLYDFFKFKKTKETAGLILQLPQAVKAQIHSVIGQHYRNTQAKEKTGAEKNILSLVISAFITGFLVSMLEAVCTGQTYLPTIVFILKSQYHLKAFAYLLIYNFMFIVPLLVIFLMALLGVTSGQFTKFLRSHLLSIKMLLALLFFVLGIFLIWRV